MDTIFEKKPVELAFSILNMRKMKTKDIATMKKKKNKEERKKRKEKRVRERKVSKTNEKYILDKRP